MVPSDDMRANAAECMRQSVVAKDCKTTYVWLATALGYVALYAADSYAKYNPKEVDVRFDNEGKLLS